MVTLPRKSVSSMVKDFRRLSAYIGVSGGIASVTFAITRSDFALGAGLAAGALVAIFANSLFGHLASILSSEGRAKSSTTIAKAEAKALIIDAETKARLFRKATRKANNIDDMLRLIRSQEDADPEFDARRAAR